MRNAIANRKLEGMVQPLAVIIGYIPSSPDLHPLGMAYSGRYVLTERSPKLMTGFQMKCGMGNPRRPHNVTVTGDKTGDTLEEVSPTPSVKRAQNCASPHERVPALYSAAITCNNRESSSAFSYAFSTLNGSHGEFTMDDDMSSAKEINDSRSRMKREADTTRHKAGGNSRKNMRNNDVPAMEIIDQDDHKEIVTTLKLDPLQDLVDRQWGVYGKQEPFTPVSISINIFVFLLTIGVVGVGTMKGALSPQHTCGLLLFVSATCAVTLIYKPKTVEEPPPMLEGAGNNIVMVDARGTRVNHVDRLSYDSWQTGKIYASISAKLISQFTGCRVDEHVVRRAMKRADELSNLYLTPLDRGLLADTVSYSLCVVNVEMARACASIRSPSGKPVGIGWT